MSFIFVGDIVAWLFKRQIRPAYVLIFEIWKFWQYIKTLKNRIKYQTGKNNFDLDRHTLTSLIKEQAMINGQDRKSTLLASLAGRVEFSIYYMKIRGQAGLFS